MFIVLEGVDRSGKTTQAARLVDALRERGVDVEALRFPDRSTSIGSMIDSYLSDGNQTLSDEVIHLLFSANRWECAQRIDAALAAGKTLVCDRYWQSGVAYSHAKGLSLEWCQAPDLQLPQPNMVIYLDVSATRASERGNYGQERYERVDFQQRVHDSYERLFDASTWHRVDASRSLDQVAVDVLALATERATI